MREIICNNKNNIFLEPIYSFFDYFVNVFYANHHAVKYLQIDKFLSIFSSIFALKCATKIWEIDSQINCASNNDFESGILHHQLVGKGNYYFPGKQ